MISSIIKLTSSLLLLLLLFYSISSAKIYVYEVRTENRRFQTASKLPPKTFLSYNGGYDVIKNLKVVKVYDDSNRQKALEDFNLENNNSNKLLPKEDNNTGNILIRYIWWR